MANPIPLDWDKINESLKAYAEWRSKNLPPVKSGPIVRKK